MNPESPIYIAGPMTGVPQSNYPAFNACAENLRTEGHAVENPAETDGGSSHKDRAFYFRHAVKAVVRCKSICLLPGWGKSLGALTEVLVGWQIGNKMFHDGEKGIEPCELATEVAEVTAVAVKCVGNSMTSNRKKHSVRSWEKEPPLRHATACAAHALKACLEHVEDERQKRLLHSALDMVQAVRVDAGYKTEDGIREEDSDDHAQNAICRAAMLKASGEKHGAQA